MQPRRKDRRAVVFAQLTAWLLPIPEDLGSNPMISNFNLTYLLLNVCRKHKNKEKEAGKGKKLSLSIRRRGRRRRKKRIIIVSCEGKGR